MAFFDLPLAALREYRPELTIPGDLDAFWDRTIAEARRVDLDPVFEPVDNHLSVVRTFDVSFSGFGGHRIRAWLHLPASATGPLPGVVEFLGYSGGRGLPIQQHSGWALAGYAHLVMDSRGQGFGNLTGDTPDPTEDAGSNSVPGMMTRGIRSPETYYYRRLFTDAVRAVETLRTHEAVDAARVAVAGVSQGGGISLAVAALVPDVFAVMTDVPFLSHFERAITITDRDPYREIARYLMRHREDAELVHRTLSYIDVAVLSRRATAPALFSVALMDQTCPPSTVFAAYNHYAGADKEIRVYPYNDHEGGQEHHQIEKLRWFRERLSRA